ATRTPCRPGLARGPRCSGRPALGSGGRACPLVRCGRTREYSPGAHPASGRSGRPSVSSAQAGCRAGGPRGTFDSMLERLLLGFITNFFDTLGIGSFAPTTAAFRARRLVSDELIPGTLNIGHTPPTLVQAIIYITVIAVDRATLALLIGASVMGAWLGAGIV